MITTTLHNGLRVVTEEIPGAHLVAVNLWYHAGSRCERSGKTGLAHLVEHLFFEGSARVEGHGHFRHLERVGALVNGSTWLDRTNYYETLPSDALPLALYLESDRMGWFLPALTEEKLETQRRVVKNERRWRTDNRPYGIWDERIFELAFAEGHPYRHPVIGYMDDLDGISLADVRDFFRTHYTPANCVLTIAGDVSTATALREAERAFGEIEGGSGVAPPSLPDPGPARWETIYDRVRLPRTFLLYRLAPYGDPLVRAAGLLASVMGDGEASRLDRYLVRKKRVAVDVSVWLLPLQLLSVLVISVTWDSGMARDRCAEELDVVLRNIVESPPSREEWERARTIARREWCGDMERLTGRANALSMGATYFDDPAWALAEGDRIDAVTQSELAETASKIFVGADRAGLTFLPLEDPA